MKLQCDLSIGQKAARLFAHGLRRVGEERQIVGGGSRGAIGNRRHSMPATICQVYTGFLESRGGITILSEENRIVAVF